MDRDYPASNRVLISALVMVILVMAVWEMTVRSWGYPVAPEDDKHLWAVQRAKIEKLSTDDVVIIGSSRVLFDFQLNEWEQESGRRPVMLAIVGSSPLPVLKDIADNSRFAGTLIVGYTPGLYFSPPSDKYDMWKSPSESVRHYHKRTYAERLGHWLSIPLHYTFAFLQNSPEPHYNELDLGTLIKRLPVSQRVPDISPFPFFSTIDLDRNVTMLERMTTDTAYANLVTGFWSYVMKQMPPPPAFLGLREPVMQITMESIEKLKARGVRIIYVRCPAQGPFLEAEDMLTPRTEFWDHLIKTADVPGYHFTDYEFMQRYHLPEWSHLSTPDAKLFTRDFVQQLKRDGHL